jgi:hypothetical protein
LKRKARYKKDQEARSQSSEDRMKRKITMAYLSLLEEK